MTETKTRERIDISEPLAEICGRLGLAPEDVQYLKIHHALVSAFVYLRNENGSKYIGDDGEPAVELALFEVST